MPTIHVHIPDNDQALGVVSTLLNAGFRVSIDLDEVTNNHRDIKAEYKAVRAYATGAPVKVWHDGKVETRKERIARQRAEAAVVVAERDHREAFKVMKDREREARAMKRAANQARHSEASEARSVECSSCGAKVDHPCVKPSGQPHSGFAHIDRVHAARLARGR